jgi:type I restriction enzyme R subunit
MRAHVTESDLEDVALSWLEGLGYAVEHGPDIAPDGARPERASYSQVVLEERLRRALVGLNRSLPSDALDEAFRRLTRHAGATLEARNRTLHRMLVDGVPVEYRRPDGTITGAQAQVIDFEEPENNEWLAVNQLTVTNEDRTRRPDIVLFLNGLPLAIIELKNPADEKATIWSAFKQLQTYKSEILDLFTFNELLVISDGVEARLGTLTSGQEWFKPWRTYLGDSPTGGPRLELRTFMDGSSADIISSN